MTTIRSIGALVLAVLVCLLAGLLGSIVTASSVRTWYPTIEKPAWTPPDAVFAPVWTALFVLMGVSVWLVWHKVGWGRARRAYAIFGVQLLLNVAWSSIFFGMRNPGLALIEIALLWLAIVATIVAFGKIRRSAAVLLVPYLVWVSFAAVLNLSIWFLNL